jgi:hypothetical protein
MPERMAAPLLLWVLSLVNSFPEVEEMVRLFRFSGQIIVELDGLKYNERNWFSTSDANFFNVFDFDFIVGDKRTALNEPFSVVLTESISKNYFPDENPLGKIIKTGAGEVKVTGVIKDIPDNSHLQFDLLFSTIRSGEDREAALNNWQRMNAYTYVVLGEGQSMEGVEAKMPAFMKTYWGPDAAFLSTERNEEYDTNRDSSSIKSLYATLPNLPAKLGFFTSLYQAGVNWHSKTLTDGEKKLKKSSIPTLIFVNRFDPVTPPKNGDIFKESLTQAKLFVLDLEGHGVSGDCVTQVMIDFMNTPKSELGNASCLPISR